ncbi:MAG: hypothetical protein DWQ01_03675 [Planctomycetota bacterium]|nr:MAG: hypothetical protein DWQ01_03675 [Planctomycetota bacterium]
MKACQSCQKHSASVHHLEVSWSSPEPGTPLQAHVQQTDLCPSCAKEAGIPVPGPVTNYPKMVNLLSKAFLGSAGTMAPAQTDVQCPDCGWTLRDFRQTSRFGCPNDYEVFSEYLQDLLERLHGTDEHPASRVQAELAKLEKNMEDAVAQEDYEAAANLRDQIRELEQQLARSESFEADMESDQDPA